MLRSTGSLRIPALGGRTGQTGLTLNQACRNQSKGRDECHNCPDRFAGTRLEAVVLPFPQKQAPDTLSGSTRELVGNPVSWPDQQQRSVGDDIVSGPPLHR
ncbi:MAG: hypothetical protein ACRD1R_16665 [Acidobacteriota bacterium]